MKKKKQNLAIWLVISVIMFALIAACNPFQTDSETVKKNDLELEDIDSIINIQESETVTIGFNNSDGTTTIKIQGSGTTIRITSRTESKTKKRIQSSRTTNDNWENPWDDSRWQDNKVPWLEHTQR